MLSRRLAWIAFAMAMVCFVGIAFGAAVKVALKPYVDASNPDTPLEPDAKGRAVLNYAKGANKTEIQVNCWGLMPNAEYEVFLDDGGWVSLGTFTTDEEGDGALHARLDGNKSGLAIAVNNSAGLTVLLGP